MYFIVAQIRLERRGGGALECVGRYIGIAMRGVGGGNGLAKTDDGKGLILEGGKVCQSLGVVNCHIFVFRPDSNNDEAVGNSLFTSGTS